MAITHEQCWDGSIHISNVKRCIGEGHSVLILMRGVPGSGKSHLARELVNGTKGVIHSTDDFFVENGVYKFDANKLQDYHSRNLKEAKKSISNGITPVIIDNTNIYSAHMKPYITQAVKSMYEVYFVEPETAWKKKASECARRNTHSIPAEKISYLLETFETVNLQQLIKPVYLRLKPPLDPPALDELSSIANDFARFFTGIKESQLQSGYSSTKSDHPHSKQLIPWNTFAIPVKKLVPVPPTDDSCSTSKGVNLCGGTKIESKKVEQPTESRKNNGQKNTSNPKSKKEPANKQMLSLLPFKQPSNMPKMSIGIQTSDIIALLDRTNSIDEELQSKLIIKPQLTIIKRLNVEQRIIRKDRSTQTCSDSVPTELDLLLALFPEEAPADLAQVLELGNIDVAVRIFREIGAKMNVFAHFDHVDVGAEDILLSRTYERSRVDSPGEQQQSPVVNAIHASADNNSDFHRKPIRNGFYRMQLSTDMMQNLGQLFGDHDESQRKNTNFVDLPLWQWRQIYQAWQGLPVTGRHGELVVYEDFDDEFPDTLNRINEEFISQNNLNSSLQTKRIVKTKEAGRGFRKLDTASRLQLNQLYEKFPAIDRSRIDECFKDNNYSSQATEVTLAIFMEDSDETSQYDYQSGSFNSNDQTNNIISDQVPKPSRLNGFIARTAQIDLENIQQETVILQEEIERCLEKKKELYDQANRAKDLRIKQFYITEAQNFDRRAREYSSNVNDLIESANFTSNTVDLHSMNVTSALKLLRKKLDAVDRPLNMRTGRSGKKLTVITGYGKSSNGLSKLKPAVIQWLKQCGYEFSQSPNPGEIVVETK